MRTQNILSIVASLAIAGCGSCEHALEPQTGACNGSHGGSSSDEIPYTLVKANEDGTRVILYYVELMVPQNCITIDDDGLEVMSTEMKPITEERMATVPPGEDIEEFIRVSAGGRIPMSEPPAAYTSGEAEPAPVPPAPPIPEEDRKFAVFPSR